MISEFVESLTDSPFLNHDSRMKEANERTIAEITGAIDRSTSTIIDNTNQGFDRMNDQMKGQFAIAQSHSKIHHRETLNAFDRIEDGQETTQLSIKELTKSVRKQQILQERCMQLMMERENIKNEEFPTVVTTTTASLSYMTGDEVSSPDMHKIRSNLFKGPEELPSIPTTPDNSTAIADASYSDPKANVLKDKNAGLKKELKKEKQTTASIAAKLRQTEKQLKTWTSPRNKKPENVQPLKVPQTEAQRQAEMKYIEQRRRGKMEQIKAQKLLESERVPISRRTRSRRRAAENT